jgi:hypothetical protein
MTVKLTVTFDTVSQIAHVLGGCFLVEHIGRWSGHTELAYISVLALAALKEGYIDPKYEDVATRGSGLRDYVFWVLGAVIGALLA